MTNEEAIRRFYHLAEIQDVAGCVNSFTPDGEFVDESTGIHYRGPDELGKILMIYAKAFSDMHRELYNFYVMDDIVVVELALQGTNDGPFELPQGTLPPTGNRMDAPCCDVFRMANGKIQLFNCYVEGSIILAQLGVLSNLEAALTPRSR